MQRNGYNSVRQLQGLMSQRRIADPDAFERANYIRTLEHYDSNQAEGNTPKTAVT
jgi:dihydroorotate dehydrogenase (fumarate)